MAGTSSDIASEEERLSELLGEALRRGPGSPEWHDAVLKLREGGAGDDDESNLLLTARERLAAGQDYRSVRAGPAFTKATFEQIDAPPEKARPRLIWIAAVCSAVVLIASAAAVVVLVSHSQIGGGQELSQRLFIAPLHQYGFLQPTVPGLELDKQWHIDRNAGLRPSASADTQRLDLPKAVDLTMPVCVECVIDVQRGGDNKLALIATSNTPANASDGGESVELELGRGGVTATHGKTVEHTRRDVRPGTYVMRLKLDGEQAIAEIDGKAVWSGPAALGKSARLAIEFRSVGRDLSAVRVEAVRVLGVDPTRASTGASR